MECHTGGLRRRNPLLPPSTPIPPARSGTLPHPAGVVRFKDLRLMPQLQPPVQAMEEFAPVSVSELSPPGTFLVEFPQNFGGVARVTVRGGRAGDVVTVRHAELLEGSAPPPQGPARDALYVGEQANAANTDTYVLSGRDAEVLSPKFTYHGFRYVR